MRLYRAIFRPTLRAANAARDERNWLLAAERYRRYLRFVPFNGPVWVQLGNCLKEALRLEDARRAYERAERVSYRHPDLYLQLGHLANITERPKDAVKAFRRAVELDPDYGDALKELTRLEGANAAHMNLVHPVRDRRANQREAKLDRQNVARSAAAIRDFLARLPSADSARSTKIPKMLHFVFGFKDKGDIPYYGYMAIRSAMHFNPGWPAYYYTMHEPVGPNWDRIKNRVKVVMIDDFDYYGNARLHHYAHKADIVRMLVLANAGGVYLDIDSITQRSFADLMGNDFVMGVQAAGASSSSGLCNAIMLGRPQAPFIVRWLKEYDYFRSKGRDNLWDYHSVKLTVKLASEFPEDITVLDYRAFFFPLWYNIDRALFSDAGAAYKDDYATAYCFHLWNGATGPWLDDVDDNFVASSKSVYAQIARQVATELTSRRPVGVSAQAGGASA